MAVLRDDTSIRFPPLPRGWRCPPLTREQCREIDRVAEQEFGIPGIVLMENASRGAAEEAYRMLWERARREGAADISEYGVEVVCGGGNNGGDGYALARHLYNGDVKVNVFSLVPPAKLSGAAAANRRILERTQVEIIDHLDTQHLHDNEQSWRRSSLIVDAIFGTGLKAPMKSHFGDAITRLNRAAAEKKIPILALDLPSGLDCDTGIPCDPTVRADVTVTFVSKKIGFKQTPAKEYLGRVVVAGIGAPREVIEKVLKP